MRRLLSALLRPFATAVAALRARPALLAAVLIVGLMVFVATLAATIGGSSSSTSSGRTPAASGKRASADSFSYSELRDAMSERKVKSATIQPAQFKAEVVLTDGTKHTVGYAPT